MKKKLIEVALPLEAINKASAREKSIRHGHPSTLHLWWARRPLAACRAVLFASLVDDPGDEAERQRLFKLIEDLVQWENVNNESLLDQARAEILKSTGGTPPPICDPFCGGGSVPLEAQRLGLKAYGSDLNPVAVLITKALVEIPPKFRDKQPVNPEAAKKFRASWAGNSGLADDVRYYGTWIRDQAKKRIHHLYPGIKLKDGSDAKVIAWLWARTVPCPNPACGAEMLLIRSFLLSSKKGSESWLEPIVDKANRNVTFRIVKGPGQPPTPPKVGRGAKFRCLCCGEVAPDEHIKAQGRARRMGAQLIAIVAETQGGRVFVEPNEEHKRIAESARPEWEPDQELAYDPRNIWCRDYGLVSFADLFTRRQLVALTTFSDLVGEARAKAVADGAPSDYASAIATYLGLGVSRLSDICNANCVWETSKTQVRNCFGRQAIPMVWDYAEPNVFAGAAGDYEVSLGSLIKVFAVTSGKLAATVVQQDAATVSIPALYATDPPYYDNISYADLSDFFYVWLRRSLGNVYPDLFSTLLVPKKQELVATPYRHGSKDEAQAFFESGFAKVVAQIRAHHNANYPLVIFYAFKQAESSGSSGESTVVSSTGWETMLQGLLEGGFQVDGTWPIRTELVTALKREVSALASSFVLVCRLRLDSAPVTTRKDFLAALKRELPSAVRTLQQGNIAPVDLQQASIGPGMAIFSRYQKVLETDGSAMKVRIALALINQMLDEALSEQESDFDPNTRFALAWFEQYQFGEGNYGQAEVLATAKAISVGGLAEADIAVVRGSRVRLLSRSELPDKWDPHIDGSLMVWQATQHLIRSLENGVGKAAELAGRMGGLAETARELAYRLYTICERKGWAEEAQAYNGLVVNWPDIRKQAEEFTLQ